LGAEQHKQNKEYNMKDTIQLIGGVLGALLFVGTMWALAWVGCAMSDACWYAYTGQL